jgi:hypothetical protein
MHKSGANLRYNVTFGDQNSTNYNVVDRPSHVITFKPKSSALTSKHDCQVVVVGVQPLNDLGQGLSFVFFNVIEKTDNYIQMIKVLPQPTQLSI